MCTCSYKLSRHYIRGLAKLKLFTNTNKQERTALNYNQSHSEEDCLTVDHIEIGNKTHVGNLQTYRHGSQKISNTDLSDGWFLVQVFS